MSSFYRPATLRGPRSAAARTGRWRRAAAGWALAATLLVLAAGALLALRFHPRFAVTRVVLEGVPAMRRAEAERLTATWIGRPTLFTDLEAPIAALARLGWVQGASARRVVPDTVVVSIRARPPVALARRDGTLWTVDAAGTWLGTWDGRKAAPGEDWVLVDPGAGGEPVDALARGALFVSRLRDDDPALFARLSEVEVTGGGFAAWDRASQARLLFGGDALEPGRAAAAWRAYLALRPELERHALLRSEVDLRFRDRIILNAPRPEAAAGRT